MTVILYIHIMFTYTVYLMYTGCPEKKDTNLIVDNCFGFPDRNFYFKQFEKRGLTFLI